ncbi:maltose/moltooligosaccharide transporter [Blastomonas natatoria]|uniref:Maltose/moltooligosaccharide transporter n=1 Tax=Blastomonas natatoria TaxID=34015 RepID=A0A2V3UV69_9SPHN|nr:MFS transporter [Blastomonas natatoria]PXW70094.1 maltose/moltooligosaccharide transporter [Blastomonas natatoria]
MIAEKPRKSFWQLFNLSFGFFGIQIGFALQNANMSRIFQSLGESLDNLPALWIAAPLTGLLVQPIVGHYSDRTWTRLGRRRPYFLAGAVLAALSLVIMPLAQSLLLAAMMLWILDASLNISMEPFRAFVGDNLRKDQHTMGYAIQTAFIGAGAVAGSLFPYLLTDLGVANTAPAGQVPDTVRISFWFGAVALFLAVLWTILTTREYSPEEMRAFAEAAPDAPDAQPIRALATRTLTSAIAWIAAGAVVIVLVWSFDLEKEVYLLGGLLGGYGLASLIAIRMARAGRDNSLLGHIVGDFSGMPPIMKRLSLVQFFSWSALFIMWIYTTPVVAQTVFGAMDASSPAYNAAGNWVGVLFAIYNGIAAVAALTLLPWLAARIGKVRTHALCLLCGAAGFASFLFIRDAQLLIVSEIGIGIAWASILAMPYAILASSLPQAKLGIFMGLFNVFVVLPQLLVATVMGSLLKALFPTEPVWTMAFAAAVLGLAALATLRVPEPDTAPV